jgi:hypothetical protein
MNNKGRGFARAAGASRPAIVCVAGLLAGVSFVHAAGGHHAVDDAALLDPGQCQLEVWADRERGRARTLMHLGPACRVGAVELGLNLDRVHAAGSDAVAVAGPQVKWAASLGAGLSAGVVVAANWQDPSPRYLGSTVVLPVSWQASESVLLHLNVGRDLRAHASDDTRAGAAIEWTPHSSWLFVAERFREGRTSFWRAGARWVLDPALNLDLSYARGVDGSAPSWWTFGLTWLFDR